MTEQLQLELAGEEWRPVVGYEGRYEVSNLGRVRSLGIRRGGGIWLLRPVRTTGGYLRVTLYAPEGTRRNHWVHILVALAFIGPRPPGHEVRHLDGNPTNAVSTNLAYGTAKENAGDRERHGTDPRGERNGFARLTAADVRAIRAAIAAGEPRRSIARRMRLGAATVDDIAAGRTWRHVA